MSTVVSWAEPKQPPKTIKQLRALTFEPEKVEIQNSPHCKPIRCQILSYRSGGIRVHALVAKPPVEQGSGPYPVIVANHGFHPDPPNYGYQADGQNARPGNYYRSAVHAFANAGYMVVVADYRGHNDSEGSEYAQGPFASNYYTEDVLALLKVLPQLPEADANQVFMWGHSLGGEVSLRALLASQPNTVTAASIWSSVGATVWDQAYFYQANIYKSNSNPLAMDQLANTKPALQRLRAEISNLNGLDWRDLEPSLHLELLQTPLLIQHSVQDPGANYDWSRQLATTLYRLNKPYQFYSYAGSDHLFSAEQFKQAVARDIQFFKTHAQIQPNRKQESVIHISK